MEDTELQEESVDTYEALCVSLYTYRYGAIGFLELLAKFEEMLGLPSPQTDTQKALDSPE